MTTKHTLDASQKFKLTTWVNEQKEMLSGQTILEAVKIANSVFDFTVTDHHLRGVAKVVDLEFTRAKPSQQFGTALERDRLFARALLELAHKSGVVLSKHDDLMQIAGNKPQRI